MRTRVLLVAALVACAAPKPRPPKGEVALTVDGKVVNGPFRFGAEDLSTLPRRTFEAAAPFAPKAARFEGVAVAPLLGDAMELAPDGDVAVFHGKSGAAAPVPVAILQYLKPTLADKVDGVPVASWRAGTAPLVLSWPSHANPGLDSDPRIRWWWLDGVTRIEVLSWATTYARALRVPAGASDRARLGAEAIATDCIVCHRLRGMGGTRGPALDAKLAGDGPALARKLRRHEPNVAGALALPDATATRAAHIAEFLRAVEVAGPLPKDEQPSRGDEPQRTPAADEAPPVAD